MSVKKIFSFGTNFEFVILQALFSDVLDMDILSLSSLFDFAGIMADMVMFAFGNLSLQTRISSVHCSHVIVFVLQSLIPTWIKMCFVDVFNGVLSSAFRRESTVSPEMHTLLPVFMPVGILIPLMHESPTIRCV